MTKRNFSCSPSEKLQPAAKKTWEPVDFLAVLVTYETVAGETNCIIDAMNRQPNFKDALGRLMGMAGKALRKRLDRNLADAGFDLTAPQMILLIDYLID